MISPIMRPCTVISASHSEQRAICCVPPLNSITSCQINKNALHPPSQEGRRAFHAALVVPPSFIDASRHQPCRVRTYSSPLSGASGRGLLSQLARYSGKSGGVFTFGRVQTAFLAALVVPPTFVDASRHQPCRVRTYSSPLSGASGRGLLSQLAISSRNSGVFFAVG